MSTDTDVTKWLSPKQAAQQLGLTPDWVRGLCKSGKLVSVLTANGRLIDPASVDSYAHRPASMRKKKK